MLRILCLHGYRQNATYFKEKLGGFRKLIKKTAELVFVSAPLEVSQNDFRNESGTVVDGRGWWFSREDNYFRALDPSDFCYGFEESLKVVEKVFAEEGPFDGILGFSQGAAFAAILCSMQQKGELSFQFQFAVIVAGFKSLCTPHGKYYADIIRLPSLHVFGETDGIIGTESSEDLLKAFENPVVIKHPGGHYMPASSQQKPYYIEFLTERLKLKEVKD
ncbi:hypothetical protein J437_LFUL013689 [Ladona fulva]|uniref:Serine hydrolase domain-containing protein n=1 Tax=Ladona fulva TaxID=123851 RepID=A0A8K0KDR2_LADFU|nr:hypothetical protein J437_LFUL013689 [Ladona fulva]